MTRIQTQNGQPANYNISAPTLNDGQAAGLQVDVNGNLKDSLATLLAGEDLTNNLIVVENRYSYTNITGQSTTTVKASAGFLHAITVNTPVATSVITIYDNTAASGTKIGTITLPGTLLSEGPMTAIYNVTFGNGLTIVTGTASSDITISWR